jgi:alpha-beta hydrolase superfamily lysophospholipase
MARAAQAGESGRGASSAGVDERLVYRATVDGLDLRGVLLRRARARGPSRTLCIWIHTRQQNFAEQEYVRIGHLVAARGADFLSVDTRGHDFGSWFRTGDGPILYGSAWERFSDCVYDLDAWVDFAADSGYGAVALVGHGFGGAKALHFQAQRQRPEVGAVVLASSGAAARDKFTEETGDLAREMVAAGRGRDLMPWGTGGDTYTSTVSAEWYLARETMHAELYGTESLPPAVARIRAPIVAWYGALEQRRNRDVSGMLVWLQANAVQAPSFSGRIVPGLGFFYRGREAVVADLIVSALKDLGIGPARLAG